MLAALLLNPYKTRAFAQVQGGQSKRAAKAAPKPKPKPKPEPKRPILTLPKPVIAAKPEYILGKQVIISPPDDDEVLLIL